MVVLSSNMFKLVSLFSMLLLARSILGDNPAQDVFILAGQSNMAGWGGVASGKWDGSVPPQCQPNPSILRLTANLTWEEARDPLHDDIDVGRICGVGPGMAFANELRTRGSGIGVLGLVPCAVGGTAISKWARGSHLYNQLDLRSDLNLPSLPFIQVALASGEAFVEIVRKAQMEINLPIVKCVDAKGLPLKADNLHLTTMGEVKVGLKLAHAFLDSFVHLR
ncbi:Domain of Uncharacterized protein function (DUF303), putative [Theobroma cacao]|uniref:Domain of Uncharacterized protein function (DUF303), putative n=1 Tax=Theobroma cacao TaxID=3641 RepID=A0A061FBS4_THECC|nr:Domain of Uncharacterized protein function (DUF303), putative [Theobroma cacao]